MQTDRCGALVALVGKDRCMQSPMDACVMRLSAAISFSQAPGNGDFCFEVSTNMVQSCVFVALSKWVWGCGVWSSDPYVRNYQALLIAIPLTFGRLRVGSEVPLIVRPSLLIDVYYGI
jgi:hypothetical protein